MGPRRLGRHQVGSMEGVIDRLDAQSPIAVDDMDQVVAAQSVPAKKPSGVQASHSPRSANATEYRDCPVAMSHTLSVVSTEPESKVSPLGERHCLHGGLMTLEDPECGTCPDVPESQCVVVGTGYGGLSVGR